MGADPEAGMPPPGRTTSGLPRRLRRRKVQAQSARARAEARSPDAVFEVIARYESGRRRGLRDAAAGPAGVLDAAHERAGGAEEQPPAVDPLEDRVQPSALPRRTPQRSDLPERAESEQRSEPRPAEEAFELVARYEWGRRRARLGQVEHDDTGRAAPAEDE
jgi:hypothetical protein